MGKSKPIKGKELDSFKLQYEELEQPKKKTRKKPTYKGYTMHRLKANIKKVELKHVIICVGYLSVIVSIMYSTYVTRTFVTSDAALFMLMPQIIFIGVALTRILSKLRK